MLAGEALWNQSVWILIKSHSLIGPRCPLSERTAWCIFVVNMTCTVCGHMHPICMYIQIICFSASDVVIVCLDNIYIYASYLTGNTCSCELWAMWKPGRLSRLKCLKVHTKSKLHVRNVTGQCSLDARRNCIQYSPTSRCGLLQLRAARSWLFNRRRGLVAHEGRWTRSEHRGLHGTGVLWSNDAHGSIITAWGFCPLVPGQGRLARPGRKVFHHVSWDPCLGSSAISWLRVETWNRCPWMPPGDHNYYRLGYIMTITAVNDIE